MKKDRKFRFFLWLMIISLILWVPMSWKASAQTYPPDVTFHMADYETLRAPMAGSLDSSWKSMLDFQKEQVGVRLAYTNACQNVRVGSDQSINADGLHIYFNNFSRPVATATSNLAIMLAPSDAQDFVNSSSTICPFALVLNPDAGTITAYLSKRFSSSDNNPEAHAVLQDNALKVSNLTGKLWGLALHKKNDSTYTLTISGLTSASLTADIPVSNIKNADSSLNLSSCYVVFNTWGGYTNTFTYDLLSYHGGESACADTCSQSDLNKVTDTINKIKAVSGKITYQNAQAIKAARQAYNALSATLKTLVVNYEYLPCAEEVVKVSQAIQSIGTVTVHSESVLNNAQSMYNALTSDEKLMLGNYQTLSDDATQYMVLAYRQSADGKDPPTTIVLSASQQSGTSGMPSDLSGADGSVHGNTGADSIISSSQSGSEVSESSSNTQSAASSEKSVPSEPRASEASASGGLSAGAIAGIIVGAVIVLAGAGVACYFLIIKRRNAI